eukprot:12648785-Ditylum_brightwellii.AAC.1
MVKDVTIASTIGIATTQQMGAESPSTNAKEACAMEGRTDPARVRRCVSAVARPNLVMPCLMETRIYTQSSMRKSPQLLFARKRRIST